MKLVQDLFSTDYGLINAGIHVLQQLPLLGPLMPANPIDWLNEPDNIKPAIAMIVFRSASLNVAAVSNRPRTSAGICSAAERTACSAPAI